MNIEAFTLPFNFPDYLLSIAYHTGATIPNNGTPCNYEKGLGGVTSHFMV